MSPAVAIRRLVSSLAAFARDRRGLAMVEFAIVLPVMLLLYLGGTEVVQAITVKRLTVLTASTVANLVTQYTSISASQQMPDILAAATTVLTPYSAANAIVTVSCITIDGQGKPTVAWSQSSVSGQARPVGQSVTVPAALDIANSTLVLGETTYAFTAAIDWLKLGTIDLYSSVFMVPRASASIGLTS